MRPRKFEYTPFVYDEENEVDQDRRKISFSRLYQVNAGRMSFFRMILIFLAVLLAYFYLRRFI